MYSTSELDELFQILNSIKGFKLDNHIGATQQSHLGQIILLKFPVNTRSCYLLMQVAVIPLFPNVGSPITQNLTEVRWSVTRYVFLRHLVGSMLIKFVTKNEDDEQHVV